MIIDSFKGKYRFLSNFYPAKIKFQDIEYPSVEHAYQAQKTIDIEERKQIALLKTPGEAKKWGRKIKKEGRLRHDWENFNLILMQTLVFNKFMTHENIKRKLLDTGDAKLIEGNYFHDCFYGSCFCDKCKDEVKYNF